MLQAFIGLLSITRILPRITLKMYL